MREFDLIKRYFQTGFPIQNNVLLGIGDDAALCTWHAEQAQVIAVDTLVAGVHFPINTAAADIAYKALAVNLSDMAAMGATPLWFTLALTLPQADETWLNEFATGLRTLAHLAHVALIGGDTTQGPLTVTIQIHGSVPVQQALRRNNAQVGDGIYVTGTLGDAGLGLAVVQNKVEVSESIAQFVVQRLNRPSARWEIGQKLRGIANSAIDVSDGLVADLGHILQASGVGARLQVIDLPLSEEVRFALPPTRAYNMALTAGDDYELCFTVAPENEAALKNILNAGDYTRIGTIEATPGLRCEQADGTLLNAVQRGYEHFSHEGEK